MLLAQFPTLLGVNGEACDRTHFQPLQADRFAGFLTESVFTILDALEGLVDLGQQFAVAVAGAQFQRVLGFPLRALGFGLIFGTTGIVHFAYGPVYTVAAYATWAFVALLGFLSVFWPGPNYGIDFKGGTEVQLRFNSDLEQGQLRQTLEEAGYPAEVVSVEGRADEYMIRVGAVSTLPPERVEEIKQALDWSIAGVKVEELKVSPGGDKITLRMHNDVDPAQIEAKLKAAGVEVRTVNAFGARDQHRYEAQLIGMADQMLQSLQDRLGEVAPEAPLRVEWVGPKAGRQLRDAAIKSILWTILFIMGYVAMRFDLRFAPGGVIALLHDVVFTVGVYALVGIEVSPASVIGFLTILGYSIYDTIVVFDKVRENTEHAMDTKRQTFAEAAEGRSEPVPA